ncbi:MAG TPA: hypothetical protein VFE65_10810 [Pseudonocardia sp.]|nr:hypothetical protein [Pseudonocardia sp.]
MNSTQVHLIMERLAHLIAGTAPPAHETGPPGGTAVENLLA